MPPPRHLSLGLRADNHRTFRVPVDVVTEPIGIFANRGFGKTSTAVVLVEELYRAGQPAVILDIKGDWWGLRSTRTGKPGLPFVIFGGDHADIPLEPDSGPLVARLVAERRLAAVIDLSELSKTKARTWVMHFAEELYQAKRRHTEPLMVIVDEADVLIPQRLSAELMRLLGAMEDIAKRGRSRGLGLTVISQRVADVNKSVTDLLTTLVLLTITGVRTRKAVMEWIDDHARPDDDLNTVLASLSSMPPGTGWVWSPAFLGILAQVNFRAIDSYDSHATPRAGDTPPPAAALSDVDPAAISAELAGMVERRKLEDPAHITENYQRLLRERDATIRELHAQLSQLEANPKIVERPLLDDDAVKALVALGETVTTVLHPITKVLEEHFDTQRAPAVVTAEPLRHPDAVTAHRHDPVTVESVRRVGPVTVTCGRTPETTSAAFGSDTALGRLVNTLGWLEHAGIVPASRVQLALFAGVSPKSSGYSNNLGALRSRGMIDYPSKGTVGLTAEGRRCVISTTRDRPTNVQLWHEVHRNVGDAKWRILERLIAIYPREETRENLAANIGVSAASSGYSNNLGALRSAGFITYPSKGTVAATNLLFVQEL